MNKKLSLKKYEIISTIFIILIGMLLHFTFKWSNNNSIVGMFSAVNESVWEHLKILFFPMFLTTIIGYFYYRNIPNYLCSKTKGLFVALGFIIIFFYTYTGIIGTHYPIVDIISFIIAIIIGEYYTYKKIKQSSNCNTLISSLVLLILAFSFIIFTFNPPHINIFKDPETNVYGIKK